MIGRLLTGIGGGALTVSVFLTWYSLNLGALLQAVAGRLPDGSAGRFLNNVAGASGLTIASSGWHAVHVQSPPGASDLISGVLHIHSGPWVALFGGVFVALGGWAQLGRGHALPVEQALPYPSSPGIFSS